MSSDASLAKAHSWMSRRPNVEVKVGWYGRSRRLPLSFQRFFEVLNRPLIAVWEGGGWRLWGRVGELGQAGLVHSAPWRAMLQWVVFMHLSVVRTCMEEWTGVKRWNLWALFMMSLSVRLATSLQKRENPSCGLNRISASATRTCNDLE